MTLPTLICIPLITSRADGWIEELGELRGKGEIFLCSRQQSDWVWMEKGY